MVTDPYSLVETGISDRLRAAMRSQYFPQDWQVTDNDSDLHRGAEHFIVTRPGAFSTIDAEYKSGEIQTVDWESFLRLYVKYNEKAEQWERLKPFRAAVINNVMKYRFLDAVTIAGDDIIAVPGVDRVRSIQPTEPAGYFW